MSTIAQLRDEQRAATAAEHQVLARWGAWGALPQVFDETKSEWTDARAELRALLTEQEYAAARRTTINAHYTDPAYVGPMWDAVRALGFVHGRVLEPGCGAGTFIGLAPDGVEMTGVELDPISAEVAAYLYPQASVRAESFARTRLPAGYFDAAIGNVPFADVSLHDPTHNRGRHAIHNHFIIKSLHLTRPGGIAAFLTSRYTMDATNPAARREMNALADLVGAVRLPGGAHRRAAGTEVVTDLLILRRRPDGEPVRDELWETVGAHQVDGHVVRTNNYFIDRPEQVLGTYQVGHGMYGEQTLHVVGDVQDTGVNLRGALEPVLADAIARGLVMTEPSTDLPPTPTLATPDQGLWQGHLTATQDGTFTVLQAGVHQPLAVPKARARELTALLDLRDQVRGLLSLEAVTGEDTDDLIGARANLKTSYDAYYATYGPLNRVTRRSTGRVDPATGEERTARVRPAVMATFRKDPFAPVVLAIEKYDEDTGAAVPAAILTQRVVVPRTPVLGVDDPAEALTVSLDTTGRADLQQIAHLLGTDTAQARARLGTLVYDDPTSGQIVPAAQYLSGNVVDKLDHARAGAETDPRYEPNVRDLRAVQPARIGMDEIEPRIGAAWIDAATHEQFLRDLLDDPRANVEHGGGAMWEVKAATGSVAATSQWGTGRLPAPAIFKATLEQRTVQVSDEVDGRRVLNPTETEAAREKQSAQQERFAQWLWSDPERAEALVEDYNRRFNSLVLRDYTSQGERLTLPGLAKTFTPRPHQRTAVARMISEPAIGLFHEVGAGKTAEMAMGVMELKRLAMVSKPAVVVPNHMLEQFSREWLQMYPQARVLAASSQDLAGDQRRLFVARAAADDWDAIIMTRGAFERIPVDPATENAYMRGELDELRASHANAQQGHGLTVKRLEKKIAAAEERLKARLDGANDPGITFEQTGIDYLVVDEAHEYKNLATTSNIPDAAIEGSRRASDLHMKLEYLRGRHGERVATLATATPIANSVTEAHVMQRYLRPDLLRAAGVKDFDAWAATFGQTVTEIELGVAGGYRQKTRFARFQNVPEMLRLWHTFADVKTAEDLNLPTPALKAGPGGKRGAENVVLPAPDTLLTYVEHLADRAEMVKSRAVDSSIDNMLLISSDGRKAALDMRLVGAERATGNKVETAATRIAAIWRQNKDLTYSDAATGAPSPTPGALQIVFCDLSTPREGWNVYDELRDQLLAHGLPRGTVRFIHEAKNDADKAALFAACRSGQVAVIIGSTSKMGIGTNIQDRAIALHHLDCPWRPADLQQRDGRILRQGNQNPEVSIHRWVVERSFDTYSWQTVERKARFIAQIMRGRLDVREIDDIGDTALSFAEVKALSSGDPLILEREQAGADLTRLERLERAWHRNQTTLTRTITATQTVLDRAVTDLPLLSAAVTATRTTTGEAFTMTIAGHTVRARAEAAEHLATWVQQNSETIRHTWHSEDPMGTVCELGGHTITATARNRAGGHAPALTLTIQDAPRTSWTVLLDDAQDTPLGLVRQMENHIERLPALLQRVQNEQAEAHTTLDQAQTAQQQPFTHAAALSETRTRLEQIETQMRATQDAAIQDTATEPGSDQPDMTTTAAPPADMTPAQAARHASFPAPATTALTNTAEHRRAQPSTRPHDGRHSDRDNTPSR